MSEFCDMMSKTNLELCRIIDKLERKVIELEAEIERLDNLIDRVLI